MLSTVRAASVALLSAALTTAVASEEGGTITGSVRLNGPAPVIPMRYPEHDVEVCGEQARPGQFLSLATNQAIRHVIVYLGPSGAVGKFPAQGKADAVLNQRDCEFVPRIQIARSGASLILKNGDPVLHVVRVDALGGTNGANPMLTMAMPYAGFEKKYRLSNFREPTLLRASSANGHDWMVAYIAVLPHPWAALTDLNGNFTILGVPAGTHKLYVWHEVLGTLTRDIKVTSGRETSVELEFTPNRSSGFTSTAPKRSD